MLYDSLNKFSDYMNEEEYIEMVKESIYEIKEDIYYFKSKFETHPQLLSKVIKENCSVDLRGKVNHNLGP